MQNRLTKHDRFAVSVNWQIDEETFPQLNEYSSERLEGFKNGDWTFVSCRVAITLDDHTLGSIGLYGVESNCGDEYVQEVETMLITEALADAQKHIDHVKAIPTEQLFLISLPSVA